MKKNAWMFCRNFQIVIVTVVLMLVAWSGVSFAANGIETECIEYTCTFEYPQMSTVAVDGICYDRVIVKGCSGAGAPGDPLLPVYGITLLLPPGSVVESVQVEMGEPVLVGLGYVIEPTLEPVPYSAVESTDHATDVRYAAGQSYPTSAYEVIGKYAFRGYELLIVCLSPVAYVAGSGEVSYYPEISVLVETQKSGGVNPLFRDDPRDLAAVTKKVVNPEMVSSYTEEYQPVGMDEYDLLILTTDEFKDGFIPLQSAHESQGITTEIKTLSEVPFHLDEATSEDIRDFLRDEYLEAGIEYLLIGGDADMVPARKLWVEAWSGGDTTFMPSDLYYGCLDGPYDYNENDRWGEPDDGTNGGDVDLVAEIYVGRACVGSSQEIDNFVEKTIDYIDSGGYSSGPAEMVGEHLWDNPDTWGGDYMDELIDGSSAHGYTTVGLPLGEYTITQLYDRDWTGHDWPKSEIINRINNGARIINHLGHSSYGYCMKLQNSDVTGLTNSDPCFIYSQGCMAGGFDDPEDHDCIAEYFTVKTPTAAFAGIWNARYGWGVTGSTDGPSQKYHREFLDAIFGEDIPEFGKANQDSKEDNLYRLSGHCMRWCYYQLNLFGDPTLVFTENDNQPPDQPDTPSGTATGKIRTDYTFTTTATDPDEDDVYYKWSWGDGTFSDWMGPVSEGEEMEMIHNWTKRGSYEVMVKVRDEHRKESSWSEPFTITLSGFPFLQWLLELIQEIFSLFFT
jgi:hypothetical protein